MLGRKGIIFDPEENKISGIKGGAAIAVSNDEIFDYSKSELASKISSRFKIKNKSQTNDRDENINSEYKDRYKEGVNDALRETVKEQYKNKYKFYGLLNKVNQVIYRITNIIPIFTDEIIIDSHKITVINRPFFFSEHIQSISIQNINDIYIETIPFFATISIVDVGLPKSHIIRIKWFWKNEAEKARRIITGLMECAKEQIDLKNLDDEGKAEKLEEIGRLREVKTTVSGA